MLAGGLWTERQGLPLKLSTYAIIPITSTSGLLETVSGAVSIDSLKKRLLENKRLYNSRSSRGTGAPDAPTLADHFEDRQVSPVKDHILSRAPPFALSPHPPSPSSVCVCALARVRVCVCLDVLCWRFAAVSYRAGGVVRSVVCERPPRGSSLRAWQLTQLSTTCWLYGTATTVTF